MNSILKIFISILAGIETTFNIFLPIIIAVLWVSIAGLNSIGSYFIYMIGLIATLFRAIKFLL